VPKAVFSNTKVFNSAGTEAAASWDISVLDSSSSTKLADLLTQ
jgi:hypothetical protein